MHSKDERAVARVNLVAHYVASFPQCTSKFLHQCLDDLDAKDAEIAALKDELFHADERWAGVVRDLRSAMLPFAKATRGLVLHAMGGDDMTTECIGPGPKCYFCGGDYGEHSTDCVVSKERQALENRQPQALTEEEIAALKADNERLASAMKFVIDQFDAEADRCQAECLSSAAAWTLSLKDALETAVAGQWPVSVDTVAVLQELLAERDAELDAAIAIGVARIASDLAVLKGDLEAQTLSANELVARLYDEKTALKAEIERLRGELEFAFASIARLNIQLTARGPTGIGLTGQ